MSGEFGYSSMMNTDHKGSGDAGASEYRSMGNGRNGNGRMSPSSPLKLFGQAKKHINEIFKDITDYIKEADAFVEDIESSKTIENVNYTDKVKEYRERVSGITEVLGRDHMKVVFFGRTSNGKSTTINAMLREKILPSGIGHTTNCFIQVEGSDGQDGYILTEEEPDSPKSVQSIKQLASALSNVKLKENSLIRILWPKQKCRLLREDVVLVDSPGIDVTPDLDLWIDKFCLDADVFVLVSNAESTLMQTEKNFFHKVSSRLSNPNIFILQNRWDISAYEDDVDQVKQQHLDRNLQFLCNELKVMDKKEGLERVYFVSSREALASRLKEAGTPTPTGILQEGFQERLFSFSNFERQFEECISKSAVRTKFEQHTNRGKNMTAELRNIMEELYKNSIQQNEMMKKNRRELADELDYMDKQLCLLTTEIKEKIKAMVEDVERKVATTLNDEIRRLAILVDEFDRPFHTDLTSLNIYKKEIHTHVEEGLGRNVQTRCSVEVLNAVERAEKEMTERLSALLPEEDRQQIHTVMPKRDFDIAYRLDCRNLCADFREDIAFHFSLSPMNLVRKVLGLGRLRSGQQYETVLFWYVMLKRDFDIAYRLDCRNLCADFREDIAFHFSLSPMNLVRKVLGLGRLRSGQQYENLPQQTPMTPQEPGGSFPEPENETVMIALSLFKTIGQRYALGSLIVVGGVYKAVGWKILAIGLCLYGGVFCYERLTWTNNAKERAFKQQYVDYAGSKLRLIVDLTSANCSHQVQQELSSTFARLCNQADICKEKLEDEIKQKDIKIAQLTGVSSKAKTFRNKADWLDKALEAFKDQFLRTPSPYL